MKSDSALPHVLLVDDEEGIRTVMSITLMDMGYQVSTAPDGETALAMIPEIEPPIVFTDVKMPGMDGLELLRRIKELRPDTEVIMVTGHGDMDMAIQSLQANATDFITKPISTAAMEVALRRSRERILMREQLRQYTQNLERLVAQKSAALVEAERQLAAKQLMEGLTDALTDLAGQVDGETGIINELPCLVSVHNRFMEIVSVNRYYIERLGDKRGCQSWDIYCHRLADDEDCPVGKTFRTGQGQRSRETVITVTGEEIPVLVHTAPIRSGDSGVELVLEVSVDIAEVNRLQEELRQSVLRYQHLFDTVPCYATVQDRNLMLLETNRRMREDFQARVGDACYRTYMHRDEPCPDCPAQQTFEDGLLHECEKVVATEDGERRNVWVQTVPILDAQNRVAQVMELSTDISQIRQLQDHLTSLGLLIGSISHGVKGLLTALDGGIYRVDSGFTRHNPDQVQAGWAVVRQMVDRIRGMVLDILYYAKRRELNWERVDVPALVEQVATVMEPKAAAQGVRFTRRYLTDQAELGAAEVDPGVLHSALVNIVENAVDACVADRAKPEHHIVFSVRLDGDDVIFDVEDNGIGMDRETQEKMFTLFFSSKGIRGTGLGMFISNQIVEQHGGRIEVQSHPGEGTWFRVSIPRSPSAQTRQNAD
ncbi:MAG: response regulator [Desulfovibrionaceae bacterium]